MLFNKSWTVLSPLVSTVKVLPSLTICKPDESNVLPLPPDVVVTAGSAVSGWGTPPFWSGRIKTGRKRRPAAY